MCQAKVFLRKNSTVEKIMENVTEIEFTPDGLRLCAFFEDPRVLSGTQIERIDFLSQTVILGAIKKEAIQGDG